MRRSIVLFSPWLRVARPERGLMVIYVAIVQPPGDSVEADVVREPPRWMDDPAAWRRQRGV